MSLQERPKLCVTCSYHKEGSRCTEGTVLTIDVVTGASKGETVDCYHQRSGAGRCGPEGRLWVARHIDIPKMRAPGKDWAA
jgi:hypothetical protein